MFNFNRNWFIEFIILIGIITLIIVFADQISFQKDGEPLLGNPLTRWWTAIALTFLWGCHQLIHDLPLKIILASPRTWISSRRQWLISMRTLQSRSVFWKENSTSTSVHKCFGMVFLSPINHVSG